MAIDFSTLKPGPGWRYVRQGPVHGPWYDAHLCYSPHFALELLLSRDDEKRYRLWLTTTDAHFNRWLDSVCLYPTDREVRKLLCGPARNVPVHFAEHVAYLTCDRRRLV